MGCYKPGMNLRKACRNLKSLYLEHEGRLRRTWQGGSLRRGLEEVCSNFVLAAGNLEDLNPETLRSTCFIQVGVGLKKLDVEIEMKLGPHLTRAFEAPGSKLEELTLRVLREDEDANNPYPERFNGGKLFKLCPNVVKLFIFPVGATRQLRSELEALHCSYGKQLRHCAVFGAGTEYLHLLRISCPKAVFGRSRIL